ncbi:MAG: hypothetical protein ACR2GF_02760 [Acidimicrobiales bacterium]
MTTTDIIEATTTDIIEATLFSWGADEVVGRLVLLDYESKGTNRG